MFAVPREKLVPRMPSFRTTGKPIVVGYTGRLFGHGGCDGGADPRRGRAQRNPRMIMHNAYGYGLLTGARAHYGAECFSLRGCP